MTNLLQVNQAPPQISGSLVNNFFAKVLQNHTLVMYENHPKALVDGLQRQMRLKIEEFRTTSFFAYENARDDYRQKLFNLSILLSDAQMAAWGYPLVFKNMDFLGQTKKFKNGTWPLFYLLDANVSKRFAITSSHRPSPSDFFPYTLPADLVQHFYKTAGEVPFNQVLLTENSKPAPKWAREHIRRAETSGSFHKLLVIGEASNWELVHQRELQQLEPTFEPKDPIVVGLRNFSYTFGPDLGSVEVSRYYVITAYDPTVEEMQILRGFTQFN